MEDEIWIKILVGLSAVFCDKNLLEFELRCRYLMGK